MIPRFVQLLACVAAAGLALAQAASTLYAGAGETRNAGVSQIDAGPDPSSLEARLLCDAADGQWNEHTLFAAGLIASGVTSDEKLRAAIDDFALLMADLRVGMAEMQTAEDRASFTLKFLHRRVLSGGYDLQATELPAVLASGRYNCVSATVLFNSLAAQADLTVTALRQPHHTCSVLLSGDRRTRVEATCADWFGAHHRPREWHATDTQPTPTTAEEYSSGDQGREISDVALVSMIYYNRGVEALRRRQYLQAIALNRRALRLDPHSSDAQGNLLAAINKQALAYAAQRNFSAAISLVEEGLAVDANHATLRQNKLYINRARHEAIDGSSVGGL